jgi:hypothetical protein
MDRRAFSSPMFGDAGDGLTSVDNPMICVLTRFHLHSVLLLPVLFYIFRKIRKEAHQKVPGLLRSIFVVENPWICYTLSVWENDAAIVDFNKLAIHINAANWAMQHVCRGHRDRIWSATWKIHSLSAKVIWSD